MADEIKDLVKMCTLANRKGGGKFVWLSWDGGNKRGFRSQPQHALTLIGMTVKGAQRLLAAITANALPKGHFDVKLLEFLRGREKS